MLYAHNSLLLIVDMQVKLLPAIEDSDNLQGKVTKLAQAAEILSVPVWATEHWPEKIGNTYAELNSHIEHTYAKTHFNACLESDFINQLPVGRTNILIAGTEAHICVLQTGLGLHQAGFNPVLLADCIGSRKTYDKEIALSRWRHYGLEIATAEMAMYEWLQTPANPAFKKVLQLIK